MKKNQLLILFASAFISLNVAAQVTPVQLGRASNIFTILRGEQNQVYANDSSGLVAFIHRQDVTVWGGGGAESGKLRYDISTDGGLNFSNDIGPLNTLYSAPARYPSITGYNLLNSTNPLDFKIAWAAPNIISNAWNGFVAGVSDATTGTPTSTETYNELNQNSLLQGGLCEGLPGEFWMADFAFDGSGTSDSIRLYKGTYNSNTSDIDWTKYLSTLPNYYTGITPNGSIIGPNVAFSPDGNTGWVGLIGDLSGGSDSTLQPIFMKSSDGGVTWNTPIEVNLENIAYTGDYPTLFDELQSFWVDSVGNPASTGRATCSFEYDITVDQNGNPHMFVVIGSGSVPGVAPGYSIYSGLVKIAADVTTDDGGATWKVIKIAPIYTFRGDFGFDGASGTSVTMDNNTQISRTEDGSHIFYSWADSDTTAAGVGFGVSTNDAPNLRIAGLRIADSYQTCPKWVTFGSGAWDGRALFPTMAPTVLTNVGGTDYSLPIVMVEMLTNNNLEPCSFWYFGKDAFLMEGDFIADGNYLNIDSCYVEGVSISEKQLVKLDLYPNPTKGIVSFKAPDNVSGDVNVSVIDLSGKILFDGIISIASGTGKIDLSNFENGFYTVIISTDNDEIYTTRIVKN
jgi:hypothetical protein